MAKLILALMIAVAAADDCADSDTWHVPGVPNDGPAPPGGRRPVDVSPPPRDPAATRGFATAARSGDCISTGDARRYSKKAKKDCSWVENKPDKRCKVKTKNGDGVDRCGAAASRVGTGSSVRRPVLTP